MAINSLDDFIASTKQSVVLRKTAVTTVANVGFYGLRGAVGMPGNAASLPVGNTTTGILLDDSLSGAPLLKFFGAGKQGYLSSVGFGGTVAGLLQVVDILWGAGAVSLAATGTTSFSGQPAITGRLPSGSFDGLELWVEITTSCTTTSPVVSGTYTNQAGTTGRTFTSVNLGAVANLVTPRWVNIPLQSGDDGIAKLDSVTVNTASAAGACNFFIVRPIWRNGILFSSHGDVDGWEKTNLVEVFDTSYFAALMQPSTTNTGAVDITLNLASN